MDLVDESRCFGLTIEAAVRQTGARWSPWRRRVLLLQAPVQMWVEPRWVGPTTLHLPRYYYGWYVMGVEEAH